MGGRGGGGVRPDCCRNAEGAVGSKRPAAAKRVSADTSASGRGGAVMSSGGKGGRSSSGGMGGKGGGGSSEGSGGAPSCSVNNTHLHTEKLSAASSVIQIYAAAAPAMCNPCGVYCCFRPA